MARLNRTGFLAIAIVFHLIYIWSIFDIYFVSPIVHGMTSFRVDSAEAPAQRLFLFVGDGLRADKAFQSFPDPSPQARNSTSSLLPRPMAPFIRSRVLSHGTFGVSHTRVPTESRPGHVALIAGLYEDVSAVMTGWKLNPVNFDSVFNRSRHTWSWGSPDILPMFKEGAVPGRVSADTYDADMEDFTKDATGLDTWVFDRAKEMFKRAESNRTLNQELRQDKNVFFLHLLGLDTIGHYERPYSNQYLHNIQLVDKGVQEIVELVENFYGDGKTAFVFTADHGMSDWGSHGDGHPDNTRTPLVAWGAGVAKPVVSTYANATGHQDGFSADWGFDKIQRNDVSQADVAALMAYLVGLDFPVNSVGELPLPYLAANSSRKAYAMLANARQILEMYKVKEIRKQATSLRYKPYQPFSEDGLSADDRVAQIDSLLKARAFDEAIDKCTDLISLALGGLRYLQTYDWFFLRTLVTAGYVGWIVFAITTVIDMHVLHGAADTSRNPISIASFITAFLAICSVLVLQKSPLSHYAYAVFPVAFWEEIYARKNALVQGRKALLGHIKSFDDFSALAIRTLASIVLLEALVQSYFHRGIYTACYLAAISWPFFYGSEFVTNNLILVVQWGVCCGILSIFTLLPVIKTENLGLILVGGTLMFATGALYLISERSIISRSKSARKSIASAAGDGFSRGILGVQAGLIGLAMLVTRSSVTSLQAKRGLPIGTQIVGWLVLLSSLAVPFLHSLRPNSYYLQRLMIIFLAGSPSFIILTISYEGLFYFAFCLTLVTWVRLEHKVYVAATGKHPATKYPADESKSVTAAVATTTLGPSVAKQDNYRAITLTDTRIALFFFFFLQSAFFSTGNIASVSSFSLDAVYRLIPVFDPFSQGTLLILKLLLPYAILSANLGILNRKLGVAPSALFMIVIAISDVMTLNFFYMVKDEGSWLDIGTTISHFFIASLLCIFLAGMELMSEVLVGGVEFEPERVSSNGDRGKPQGRSQNGVAVKIL